MKVVRLSALLTGCFYPQEIILVFIPVRGCVDPIARRIMWMKNSKSNLRPSACSAEPQPTAPPRGPIFVHECLKFKGDIKAFVSILVQILSNVPDQGLVWLKHVVYLALNYCQISAVICLHFLHHNRLCRPNVVVSSWHFQYSTSFV